MNTESRAPDPTRAESKLDPLAICTLPEDGLGDRLGWIRSEILPHAVASERTENGIAWELDDAPGLAEKLDQLIALERNCCSGMEFHHGPSRAPRRRRLEVRGIEPQSTVVASLKVDPGENPRIAARVAKAAGMGSLFSLVVCCVLPIAAAAIVGATAAAPFASLDEPWIIAGVAILSGGVVFEWQRRRRRA